MAVIKVVGKINGSEEIIFGKSVDSNQWIATTAPNLSTGRYVVEIIAYDEAGNEAYSAAMLLEFDASDMTFKLIPSNYTADTFEVKKEEFIKSEFYFKNQEENYYFKILKHDLYFVERSLI